MKPVYLLIVTCIFLESARAQNGNGCDALCALSRGEAQANRRQQEQIQSLERLIEMRQRIDTSASEERESSEKKDFAIWATVKDSRDANEYRAYLEQFPNGVFAVVARVRIRALENR